MEGLFLMGHEQALGGQRVILSACCGLLPWKMVVYERFLTVFITIRVSKRSSPSRTSGSICSLVPLRPSHATKKSSKVRACYSHFFPKPKSRLGYRLYSSHVQSTFHSPALGLGSYPPSDPLRTRSADILHLIRHQNRHRRL